MSDPDVNKKTWNTADYDEMSWHDSTIHALRFDQDGEYQSDLVLDLDYILEWITTPAGSYNFRVAPALLRFQNVDNLRIRASRQFKQSTQIMELSRSASHWFIKLDGYSGQESSEIEFDATGFIQELSGPALVVSRQCLSRRDRHE